MTGATARSALGAREMATYAPIRSMATTTAPSPTARIPSNRLSAAQLETLPARVHTQAPRGGMAAERPFTGDLLGVVAKCAVEDIAPAIARARAAQVGWAKTSFAERRAILLRFHDLMLARQEEILDLVQLE